jgi:type I restriction enzyme S subunit
MNIVGPPLGKVSMVPIDFPSANINQAIARFRPASEKIGVLLMAYLLSEWAQRWLSTRSKKTSGQQNLTLELCQTLPVPVPPSEQIDGILAAIQAVFESVRQLENRQKKFQLFYKMLLKQAIVNVQ